jgi:hypothetical protein
VSEYNYDHFKSSDYDFTRFAGPAPGDALPDFQLRTLDGAARRLSEYQGRTLVLETGSVTCPMYAKGISGMAALAQRHIDAAFVVLYVREAHPGGRVGPHADRAEKEYAARMLGPVMGDRREILIDDIFGTTHRALGAFPNMVYVVDAEGRVVFRGDWTDVDAVAAVLDGTADADLMVRQHFPPAKPSPRTAVRTLLTGGWRALFDFVVSLPGLIRMHRSADRHYARQRDHVRKRASERV